MIFATEIRPTETLAIQQHLSTQYPAEGIPRYIPVCVELPKADANMAKILMAIVADAEERGDIPRANLHLEVDARRVLFVYLVKEYSDPALDPLANRQLKMLIETALLNWLRNRMRKRAQVN